MPVASHHRVSNTGRSLLLACQSLLASRTSTSVSVLLVSTSVLCVVGAERAFVRLADVVTRLADGGHAARAVIDIERCPHCPGMRSRSPLLRGLVEVQSSTAVTVRRVGTRPMRGRPVRVLCVSPRAMPSRVSWETGHGRRSWSDDAGHAGVLVGASLGPVERHRNRTPRLGTNAGEWLVVGRLPLRPLLAHDSETNAAIVVPWRAPFTALCDRGHQRWHVEAADSVLLQERLSLIDAELRTGHGHRPGAQRLWRVEATDRFGAVVQGLVRRFSAWVIVVPVAISLLCGAGIFSVQTLEGTARGHEFGVRRALGATRRDLITQLCAEAVLVCAAGMSVAALLLIAAGLPDDSARSVVHAAMTALLVAVPLCGVGLLAPGVAAVRTSSIAALEGRGTT